MARKPLTGAEALEMVKRQRKYSSEYKKKNYINMSLFLDKDTDADIIEKLSSVPNRKGYIVGLIRKDMAENG